VARADPESNTGRLYRGKQTTLWPKIAVIAMAQYFEFF
jgi:hypothetical protein